MDMHGPTEHGRVRMRLAMSDGNNKLATWRFATQGILIELDAMNNVIFDKEAKIHLESGEAPVIQRGIKQYLSKPTNE